MNECIEIGSIFCSSIYEEKSVQLFKIIVVVYIGNSIKICSKITYILTNINRYMLIVK